MSLKVCMLCPFYPNPNDISGGHIGGVERHVQCLSQELTKLNVDVNVVTSYHQDLVENDGPVKIIRVKRKSMVFRTPIFPWRKIITKDSDILHVHGPYPFLSDLSVKVAKNNNIPSVLTYHFEGNATGILGGLFSRVYYLTLGRKMKRHTKYIATTKSYAHGSSFLKNIPQDKIEIIPNGVDTSIFNLNANNPKVLNKYDIKGKYILFVGRLVHFKGIDYLIEAMKSIENELLIVGKGPYEEKLKQLKNVRQLGYVDDEVLATLYSNASVTVLPSIYQESFGMTLIESMACGTPVVATELPGVKEVAQLGGATVPIKDPLSLQKAIKNVMNSDFDEQRLHEIASNNFSWESISKKVLGVYESLLGENS